MRPRIYLDTSVFGGCEDPEFDESSGRLLDRFTRGEATLVISDLIVRELQGAPVIVRNTLTRIPVEQAELLVVSQEVEELADAYIAEGAVGTRMRADALHIALATVARVDVLVSWNFRHIVNLSRIHAFNAVNLKCGYPLLEIRSPREVVDDE